MSHARQSSKAFRFVLSSSGTAELLSDGVNVWTSDADEDFTDYWGTDTLVRDDIGDVLDYLVDEGYLTDRQADNCYVVPEAKDESKTNSEPLEGEYIPANDEDAQL